MNPTFLDTCIICTDGDITELDKPIEQPISFPSTGNQGIELIFLGTGTSSSIPHVACLTAPPNEQPCRTCLSTLTVEGKKNMRRNTSAIVRMTGKDGKKKTVLMDVGKNFQAASIEWFPKYGLREIDAVLITHAHADAMNGLDDLRGWTLKGAIQEHIDIYISEDTFAQVKRTFPYLVAKELASGGGDVPEFKWHIIENSVPFEIKDTGIRITPFLVHHGRLFAASSPSMVTPTPTEKTVEPEIQPYLSFGFVVQGTIVYMSDVSLIPDEAWQVIESGGAKSVLVIDCLRLEAHTSHMGVREAAGAIRRVGAARSYMTGFNHDVSHEEYVGMCEGVGELTETERTGLRLMREGLGGSTAWVRPAHDGLRAVVFRGGVWDETYG